MWIIKSSEGYWNNDLGWVEHKEDATVFEHTNFNLPIARECHWVALN